MAKKPKQEKSLTEKEYHDQESEWVDEGIPLDEKSDVRHVMADFTQSQDKKLATQTDLTEDQAVMLTQIRILEQSYPSREWKEYLQLELLPSWLEAYFVSVGRKGRKETVEVLKGNVSLNPPLPGSVNPPSRF